jgi:predicted acetyltransferase
VHDAATLARLEEHAAADARAVARLLHHAFAGPIDKCEEWMRTAGFDNIRLVRSAQGQGGVAACFVRIPMAQFFGGRSVPMLGIAGVATAPEARGRGVARAMMRAALREARDEGWPISALYASTHSLYRQVGYEQAGVRFQVSVPIHRIAAPDAPANPQAGAGASGDPRPTATLGEVFGGGGVGGVGGVRPLTEADEPAVREIYRRFAACFDGMLDRGPYVWERTRLFRDVAYEGFGCVGPDGALDGYLRLAQVRKPDMGQHDVALSDVAFTNARAGRDLLRFIAGFTTMGDDLVMHGGPIHPLLTMLSTRHYRVEKRDYWMLRVLDVAGAIAARGFAPGTRGSFTVEITDGVLPSNTGRWRISADDGRGTAERVPGDRAPALRTDIRGLACLYSGLYSARQARLAGLVEGDDAAVAAAEGVLGAGTSPWMIDMF